MDSAESNCRTDVAVHQPSSAIVFAPPLSVIIHKSSKKRLKSLPSIKTELCWSKVVASLVHNTSALTSAPTTAHQNQTKRYWKETGNWKSKVNQLIEKGNIFKKGCWHPSCSLSAQVAVQVSQEKKLLLSVFCHRWCNGPPLIDQSRAHQQK